MNDSRFHYTDERNAQIVLSLLKAHGIRKVVANPGTTNIAIVGSVQNDPWFEAYSGVDERHAAYLALGLAAQSGEPVVLSCTGATASRNYLPALTEAYYRKIPVLAITSMQNFDNVGQLAPQALDRSVVPIDAVVKSVEVRSIRDGSDEVACVRKVNDAILALKRHGGGPVHINLEMGGCLTFGAERLPAFPRIERYEIGDLASLPPLPVGKRIVVFAGSGRVSSKWSVFAERFGAAVFADCGSSYRGSGRVNASLLCSQTGFRQNPKYADLLPDLIIDVGEVSGDYPAFWYLRDVAPVWRVSEDGEIRSRFGNPTCVFEMPQDMFIERVVEGVTTAETDYAKSWREADTRLRERIPELPFSNPWIASRLAPQIPAGSILHLGILNSLRSWNIFLPSDQVVTASNVGGFGIDGALSTLIGAALAEPKKLCFGVVGDLAFFYDLNSLGNRSLPKNLRIVLVNNGCGSEFNMYFHPGSQFGAQTNDYIAAGRHFGNQSSKLVRHYAEDLGFEYAAAASKDEFAQTVGRLLKPEIDKPVLLECFTCAKDESDVHRLLNEIDPYAGAGVRPMTLKDLIPQRVKNVVHAALGR